MWSFTPGGNWVQHDQLTSRSDLFSKYAHSKNLTAKLNDPQSTAASSGPQIDKAIATYERDIEDLLPFVGNQGVLESIEILRGWIRDLRKSRRLECLDYTGTNRASPRDRFRRG